MQTHNNTPENSLNSQVKDSDSKGLIPQFEYNNYGNGVDDVEKQEFVHFEDEEFSYFKMPLSNTKPTYTMDLSEVFDFITSDRYAAQTKQLREMSDGQQKFKASNFDYVTFNGTFTQRSDASLTRASNLFIIDVDHIGANIAELFHRLKNDKVLSPQLIFISPSGDGLKIVVRIDFSIIDRSVGSKIMNPIWQAVNTYFGREYSNLLNPNEKNQYIDGSGKDLSRACFLPHDPSAYLNINQDSVLGQRFIDDYPPSETAKNKNGLVEPLSKKQSYGALKVNPATSLQQLADRHLLVMDNHHPELLAFIGAAKSISTPIADTINFIKNHVHISLESAHNDFNEVKSLAEDIYSRYGTDSEGVKYLTPLNFGYGILYFKYDKNLRTYVLTSLFWDEVRNVLHRAGFRKREVGKDFLFIHKDGGKIREVSTEIMRNHMTSYVEAIRESVCFSYQEQHYQIPPAAIRETDFKNSNNIFNDVWLEHLRIHDDPIFKDTATEMYFFFKNVIVTVSREGITTKDWDDNTGFCVWEEQVIQHDFNYRDDIAASHFYKFLNNVTNNDSERMMTMCTGIGYLLHHHFRESEGQAVIFYDETITDTSKPMGGSGKGLIVNAIKQVRNVAKVDGKHLDTGNRFRWEQIKPSTQVVWIDDIKQDFDFGMLHSNLTDGWTVERKHLSQFLIEPKESPKTVICSNSIIKGGGTTNQRRQFIVELSDYYSRQIIKGTEKPIEDTHGCIFFNDSDWDKNEWAMFFSVMMNCAQKYLSKGLISNAGVNIELNRLRQATDEDFAAWVMDQGFEATKKYETKKHLDDFLSIYYGDTHQIGQRKFTGYLKLFATYMGWSFNVKQSNGISYFIF